MINKTPLISVIIPIYNDAEYLPRALESCIKQTYKNIEIITVNDASTDKTDEILSEYSKKYKQIKVLHHSENKKTFQAIKTGVLAASGSHIMVVSGDDTFDLNAAETCVNILKNNPKTDIIHFGRRILNQHGEISYTLVPRVTKLKGKKILEELFSITQGSRGSFSNKCWKRTLLDETFREVTPPKPLLLGEDQVVVFLAAIKAKSYIAIPDIIHNYYFGMGMDGREDMELGHYIDYRLNMADSMDELDRQLKSRSVESWVWKHFVALKREHYAWSAFFAGHLNGEDKYKALKAWTDRTNSIDTLVGIATFIPERFLDDYLYFLKRYKADGFTLKESEEIVRSITDYKNSVMIEKDDEVKELKFENERLLKEVERFSSVKLSAKLLVRNIKRRLASDKKG